MTVRANGRSALILATGLLVCYAAGPSRAAPAGADNEAASSRPENAVGAPVALSQYTKRASSHVKHRTSSKVAEKPSPGKNSADAAADDGDNSSAASAIPPSVANANALAPADSATGNAAKAMSVRANEIVQNAPDNPANAEAAAQTQVVAADELNDVDRALHETTPPAPTQAMAAADAPAAPVAPVMAASNDESSTWDQTSLIGKIFIGFGALLTVASAARMFMA